MRTGSETMCGIIDKDDIKRILKENLAIKVEKGQANASETATSIKVFFDNELISESVGGN